ncbi:restriction endonuclease subunit S [Polaromonas sp.]|uniref:restriction endonuclease subunit S n=1 Tax=Polaromonas sp. TaxID=1869339 RepID=UPI0018195C4E|nr:restriction endonuclease subunit S [Polaromonas sp.]NMM06955.1 restriction endonuclease subunit S [Polaromonas sp.]
MSESWLLKNFDLLATAPGGVARLRELILTLAVQGKLIPQDPNDEPASELLKKIRVEKDRLIVDGKIKRDKPLAEIAEKEKPFELPVNWAWERFGVIAGIERGGSPRPIQSFLTNEPDSLNWIKIGDTEKGGKYITSTSEKIRRDGLSKTRMVFPGDFLLTNSMSFGRPYITQIEGCIHDGWLRISPPSSLNKDFLYVLLSSRFIRTVFEASAAGGVVLNLNADKVRTVPIPLPPLAEQSRIVARVEELMKLCDALEQNGRLADEQHARLTTSLFDALVTSESAQALAENWQRVAESFDLLLDRPGAVDALEQTVLQLAVRGMLVPQDEAEPSAKLFLRSMKIQKRSVDSSCDGFANAPYETPGNWEWCKLELIAQVGTGTTPSREVSEFFSPPEVPWVTSGETGNSHIRATRQFVSNLALTETSLKVYPVGTLIVAMYGQGKTRGQVAELLIPAATNQACAAIVLHDKSEGHRDYVKLFFEKSYDEIRLQAAGGAQPNLNVGKIKSTLIPVPPLNEQVRIVHCVKQLRVLCTQIRDQILNSRQTQSTLAGVLAEMATGT